MKQIIFLALPVMISNLTNVGMGCVDTIVAGSVSSVDMAAVGLGGSIFMPVQLFAIGVLMILGPIIANMRGKGNAGRIGHLMSNSIWLILLLSVFVLIIQYFMRGIIPLISNEKDVEMQMITSDYIYFMLFGVPANLAFVALRSLNEGANMTRPAMIVGIIGLIVNIPANFVFVYGMFGMPALGGAGCGVATAIVFWVQFFVMALLVYWHPKHRPYRKQLMAIRRPDTATLKNVMKLGFPVGISLFCEVFMFCVASWVLAPLGHIAIGAHQVAGNIGGLLFMIPLSIGLGASIRIAYHSGKRNMAGINASIRCSYLFVSCFMVFSILVLVTLRTPIVEIYNSESEIIRLATMLLLLAAVYQLPDNLQVVSIGILRGFRDTSPITYITFVSYWLIGFPICVILARTDWIVPAMGAVGIWIGFIFGLAVAATLLMMRVAKTRKKVMKQLSASHN